MSLADVIPSVYTYAWHRKALWWHKIVNHVHNSLKFIASLSLICYLFICLFIMHEAVKNTYTQENIKHKSANTTKIQAQEDYVLYF